MKSVLMFLLLISGTGNKNVDLSTFRTFAVHQSSSTSEVNAKLDQVVHNAIRTALTSRGIKETHDSPDLVASYKVEVSTQQKEVTGIVVIDLTNPATGTTVWHGQHIDDEASSAKLEKRLPDSIKKMLK